MLRFVPAKTHGVTGKAVAYELTKAPMVMEEISRIPPEKRKGPVVVYERSGQPYEQQTSGSVGAPTARRRVSRRPSGRGA